MDGVPVGELLGEPPDERRSKAGSCIAVVAVDAPLSAHQLERVARRAGLGLARCGSVAHHGSGEIFVAFAPPGRRPRGEAPVANVPDGDLNDVFEAVVDATEEAVLNALWARRRSSAAKVASAARSRTTTCSRSSPLTVGSTASARSGFRGARVRADRSRSRVSVRLSRGQFGYAQLVHEHVENAWAVLRRAAAEARDDRLTTTAQALAYSLFLAIPAAFLVLLGLFSLFADAGTVAELVSRAGMVLPSEATTLLEQSLERADQQPRRGAGSSPLSVSLSASGRRPPRRRPSCTG